MVRLRVERFMVTLVTTTVLVKVIVQTSVLPPSCKVGVMETAVSVMRAPVAAATSAVDGPVGATMSLPPESIDKVMFFWGRWPV